MTAVEARSDGDGSDGDTAAVRSRVVRANGTEFTLLEAGGPGPLALCLHGFPDSAHTWSYLLPELAKAGFHAVAPFMRGYAPSALPDDNRFDLNALVTDALALHEALNADERAIIIGHDFGAEAAYGAVARDPTKWRRLVTLAIPPLELDERLFSDYDQIRRSFYIYFFRVSPEKAAPVVAANDMGFIDRLWSEWSPGFDAGEHVIRAKHALRHPANLLAALRYYVSDVDHAAGDRRSGSVAIDSSASLMAPRPTLYLHGSLDGCIGLEMVRDAEEWLAPGSRMSILEGVGHFLHLEAPSEVNSQMLSWIEPNP